MYNVVPSMSGIDSKIKRGWVKAKAPLMIMNMRVCPGISMSGKLYCS